MEVIKGIHVSPGMVIGRALVLDDARERVPRQVVAEERVQEELDRLEAALAAVAADLEAERDEAAEKLGPEPAKIFGFHLAMLHDPTLITPIKELIKNERVVAPYAVAEGFRERILQFRRSGNPVFRDKARDLRDIDRRVLGKLLGSSGDRLARVEDSVIVIARELTPAQAASIDRRKVIGFATDAGGRTDHTSIVAAALGIPVVVGCKEVSSLVIDGDDVIVDGKAGLVIIRPDAETLESYNQKIEDARKAPLVTMPELPAVTLDGTVIKLLGNIEFANEIDHVLENGGNGVGLFRTEFLYITSQETPSEEDLFESYRSSAERLGDLPLTIRTVDLGADKHTQERAEHPERNPFLGLRSIRYCLQNLPMFQTQLRAILRASAYGNIKVMFPLVTTPMELRQSKMILAEVMRDLAEEGVEFNPDIPIGIMIEVPSAALMASVFARECSFFSIGTNDLIQYTLAVDRGNERVANLYSGANPAVIQLLKSVIRSGKRLNVETSICGEIAGEVTYTMLLIGLGLRVLSLVPSQIPYVKQVVRSVDIPTCERLARKVGSLDSDRKVYNCMREALLKVVPEAEGGWTAA